LVSVIFGYHNAAGESTSVGFGDCVLHLGTNGYASLPDSAFQGFDCSKDFSLEVILNIEANAAGGRWPVMLGKKYSPPLADAGFALGLNQGHFNTFGQQVYAVVADGTNGTSLSSRYFQGTVHAAMVWNSTSKVLCLYVNGGLEGSKSNALINSIQLQNTRDFQLGGPSNYGKPLQRDVLGARLWNRSLNSEEIALFWTRLNAFGLNDLPSEFDRNSLVSEWLMDSLVSSTGGAGSTHLRDRQGRYHLQLRGDASLWTATGPLVLHFPPEDATNISKSVVLKASGGRQTLGSAAVGPLQYEIQVDETSGFSSSAFKSSGWISGYSTWKPALKPAMKFFWRARVRDSSNLQSDFVATNSFITSPPRDWYVRPGVYKTLSDTGAPVATQGEYGHQDGATYANAWNGLFSVVWGEGGVEPGDTLYVCGTHLYTARVINFLANQGVTMITESGVSEEFPITIRMDAPVEHGLIWGAARNLLNDGGTWQGPDENGVYSSSNVQYTADFLLDGTNVMLLDRTNVTTWTGNTPMSFKTNGVTYVKMPQVGNPAGMICSLGLGYRFDLSRSSYIRFQNCRFYGGAPAMEASNWNPKEDTQTIAQLSRYITFDGCDLRYNSYLTPTPGHDHWTLSNSEISWAYYGIYTVLNLRSYGANFLTVRSNYFHHLGTARFEHKDAHAVGIQGGEGHIIEANRIENTGSAIEFWTGSAPMRDHLIRFNFIKDIYVKRVTGGGGIVVSGDNATAVEGTRTGFKIYGNVIMNTGLDGIDGWQGPGISSSARDYVEIYNNTICNANRGISVSVVKATAKGRVVNNIIMNPRGRYVQFTGELGVSTNSVVDYNLFFPATREAADFGIYDIQHDVNSVFADPKCISSNPFLPGDFQIRGDSKAIKAGVDVGLLRDFAGNPVPRDVRPDIGAFQYVPRVTGRSRPPDRLRLVSVH
jgi:hypothetical protein